MFNKIKKLGWDISDENHGKLIAKKVFKKQLSLLDDQLSNFQLSVEEGFIASGGQKAIPTAKLTEMVEGLGWIENTVDIKNTISFRLATVFGASYRMRSDLLVNNFVQKAVEKNHIEIFEPKFRRNFIHIKDVVRAIIFSIENFNKLKSNVYNLGLSSANITKIDLAKKIKKQLKTLKIEVIKNRSDPDKRDYFVSNAKIEGKGFKAKISIEQGIRELIQVFKNNSKKIINNY